MKKSINKLCKQCSTNNISSCIIKHCIWAQKPGYEENSFRNTFLHSSLNSEIESTVAIKSNVMK